MKITKKLAENVWKLVRCGLAAGVGPNRPGRMCVEEAVCCALGQPYDAPDCVDSRLRLFKIQINDLGTFGYPQKIQRANALRRAAIAQLGTNDSKFEWHEFLRQLANAFRLRGIHAEQLTGEMLVKSCGDRPSMLFWSICDAITLAAPNCNLKVVTKLVIDATVDALVAMGTPGSRYIHVADKEVTQKLARSNRVIAAANRVINKI